MSLAPRLERRRRGIEPVGADPASRRNFESLALVATLGNKPMPCYACILMDESFRRRAAARRATWSGGVARSFDELEEMGLEFWRNASSSAKLNAMWQLLVDAWVVEGKHGSPPRFQGSIIGVGRFER